MCFHDLLGVTILQKKEGPATSPSIYYICFFYLYLRYNPSFFNSTIGTLINATPHA